METVINIVPPEIHEDRLEDYLATDELFVSQLNKYLSLPTFKEKYRFNATDCAFELIDDAQENLMKTIEKAAAKVKKPDVSFLPVRQVAVSTQDYFRYDFGTLIFVFILPENLESEHESKILRLNCFQIEQSNCAKRNKIDVSIVFQKFNGAILFRSAFLKTEC